MRKPANHVPPDTVSWEDFQAGFKWRQGEHLTAVGPTGSGKTTLINELINRRRWVIFLATKQKDATVDKLRGQGFKVTSDPGAIHADVNPRVIFKPKFPNVDADTLVALHREAFRPVLTTAFRAGGWTIVADEVRYLTEMLGLKRDMELLLLQGRSLGTTVVGGTQRPKHIPLTFYDQATHVFFWRDNDEENLKRIGGLGALDSTAIRWEVANLPKHQLLYVNTRTGERVQSKVKV